MFSPRPLYIPLLMLSAQSLVFNQANSLEVQVGTFPLHLSLYRLNIFGSKVNKSFSMFCNSLCHFQLVVICKLWSCFIKTRSRSTSRKHKPAIPIVINPVVNKLFGWNRWYLFINKPNRLGVCCYSLDLSLCFAKYIRGL
jgi:hypothetical protein